MQNNLSFKLFNVRQWYSSQCHSYIFGLSDRNAVRSIHIPLLAQSTGPQWPVCGWIMEESRVECRKG